MIVKEKEYSNSNDPRIKAGEEAEKQMAFYLRRAFADNPDIFVFNDLRLTYKGENAQIDHFVLYKGGFIIIESKSITGTVSISKLNDSLQWWRKDYNIGIQSPVQQAKNQDKLLRDILNAHDEKLLDKMLGGLQTRFGKVDFDILIAISNTGIVNKAKGVDVPELYKADSIVDKIKEIIKEKSPSVKTYFDLNKPIGFKDDELIRIKDFLLLEDKKSRNPNQFAPQAVLSHDDFEKFVTQQTQQSVATVPEQQSIPKCPKCGADMILRKTDNPFYGCSTYSKTYCKGTRNAQTLEVT